MDWIQTASLGVKAAPPWLWSLKTKSRETDVCSENAGAQGGPCWLQEPSLCTATSELASRTFHNFHEVLHGLSSKALALCLQTSLPLLQVFLGVSARGCLVFSLMFTLCESDLNKHLPPFFERYKDTSNWKQITLKKTKAQ